ncbi:hypothetical protein RFI_32654 [Reticulomyxa filosa]|uniref:Uncharacterized protein n=1 Tax=Reticulomyxa filosa TaxID=46433 RepID=X6LUC4_RETFI|nr:hypothetical protein RFI_32654 [Reticulomyxa filosa]|eukprot:ETO04742.1 hypothetical protein RFI_32654 [Reticulomyxa filosa]
MIFHLGVNIKEMSEKNNILFGDQWKGFKVTEDIDTNSKCDVLIEHKNYKSYRSINGKSPTMSSSPQKTTITAPVTELTQQSVVSESIKAAIETLPYNKHADWQTIAKKEYEKYIVKPL